MSRWLFGFAALALALMITAPFAAHAQIAGTATLQPATSAAAAASGAAAAKPDANGFGSFNWLILGAQQVMAEVIQTFFRFFGFILLLEVQILIFVSQYSNFVAPGPTAVQIGWQVTRDLANMFFIIILLVIAFATIIGGSAKKYNYEALLPRLLITAVVINFTKTIVGVLIDFSQVVMLTFVNGYAQAAGGNFLNAFQINKLLALSTNNINPNTVATLILGLILALIMVVVAAAVVLVLIFHLVARIVELWVLTIMAPLAFLSSTIPGVADSMYKDWWSRFKKLLVGGPMIAFFIWLALITAQQSGGNIAQGDGFGAGASGASGQQVQQGATQYGITTAAAQWDTILSMIIFIAILMAGLKVAQESGLAGASFAKKVQGGLEGMRKFAWRETGGRASGAALRGGGSLVTNTLGRVPILGSYANAGGRAMTLRGEHIAEAREGAIQKFSGKPEDIARLSPSAFKRMASKATGEDVDTFAKVVINNKQLLKEMRKETEAADKYAAARTAAAIKAREKDYGRPLTDEEKKKITIKPESTAHEMFSNLEKANKEDANHGSELKNFQDKFLKQLTPVGSDARKKGLARAAVADMTKDDIIAFAPDLPSGKAREIMESANPDHQEAMRKSLENIGDAKKVQERLTEWGIEEAKMPVSMFSIPGVAEYAFDASSGDAKSRGKLMSNPETASRITGVGRQRLYDTLNKPSPNNDEVVKAFNSAVAVNAVSLDVLKANDDNGKALRKAIAARYSPESVSKNASNMTSQQLDIHRAAAYVAIENDPVPVLDKDGKPNKANKSNKWNASGYYDNLMPTAETEKAMTGVTPNAVIHSPAEVTKVVTEVNNQATTIEQRIVSAPNPDLERAAKLLRNAATNLNAVHAQRETQAAQFQAAVSANLPQPQRDVIQANLTAANLALAEAMKKAAEAQEQAKKA